MTQGVRKEEEKERKDGGGVDLPSLAWRSLRARSKNACALPCAK